METSQPSQEEFIDMVVSPCSNLDSLVQTKEFEFQMCKNSLDKEAIKPSPADELFYKGKLLPLHLPPRLQMVQNLLHNSISPTFQITQNQAFEEEEEEEQVVTSPQQLDEFFFQWSIGGKKPWSKKMRMMIKQSLFSQKLKSSRAYMKSLFTTRTVEAKSASEAMNVSKAKEYVNKYMKAMKKNPLGQMEDILDSDMDDHFNFTCHRLSFSGVIKRRSTSKYSSSSSSSTSNSSNCSCSSSSFSLKSTNGFYEINLLKRSASANSEAGNSIEGAIAHCKKSQESSEEKRPP